jgi:PIN domain nuclease of toxin-antitoxin system
MIVLDTHIWLWWVNLEHARMKSAWRARIESTEAVGVSAISCFETAWLAQHGRIILPCPVMSGLRKRSLVQALAFCPSPHGLLD